MAGNTAEHTVLRFGSQQCFPLREGAFLPVAGRDQFSLFPPFVFNPNFAPAVLVGPPNNHVQTSVGHSRL